MGFNQAITVVLAHEGGYVNNPADPGGETKFGISKRTYPDVDIRNLTREQAVKIYKRDWWDKYDFDQFPAALQNKLFSLTVNMGWERAIELLQGALWAVTGQEIAVDGVFGPETKRALTKVVEWPTGPGMLAVALKSEAAGFYRRIAKGQQRQFLKGWLRRAYA